MMSGGVEDSINRLMASPGGALLASFQQAVQRHFKVYAALFLVGFVTSFPVTATVVEWLISSDRLPSGVDIIVVSPVEFLFLQLRMASSFGLFIVGVVFVMHVAIRGRHHEAVQARIAELNLVLPKPGPTTVLTAFSVVVLALAGVAYAWEGLTPLLLTYLTDDAQRVGLSTEWRLSGYVGFILSLVLASVIGFQTPVITTLALRLHIVERAVLRSLRRHVWFAAFVLGALLSPPDPLSLFLVALPVIVLFEAALMVDGWIRDETPAPAP